MYVVAAWKYSGSIFWFPQMGFEFYWKDCQINIVIVFCEWVSQSLSPVIHLHNVFVQYDQNISMDYFEYTTHILWGSIFFHNMWRYCRDLHFTRARNGCLSGWLELWWTANSFRDLDLICIWCCRNRNTLVHLKKYKELLFNYNMYGVTQLSTRFKQF